MTLEKLWDRIGKQSLKITRKTEATVIINDNEYVITDIEYENGKWLHMNAKQIKNNNLKG